MIDGRQRVESVHAERLDAVVSAITGTDPELVRKGLEYHDRLTKPPGSLGRLERLGAQLCAISASIPPPLLRRPAVAVFAGDHGVVARGVSPWPQEVTAQMVANFCNGGAAINVLARQFSGPGAATGAVTVIDVGVAGTLASHPNLLSRKVRHGTADISVGPAMTMNEAARAVLVGVDVATELIAGGADLLVGGEMGIGNTTAAAGLVGMVAGRDAVEVTGRGTGIDDATLQRKTGIVAAAMARLVTDDPARSPLHLLAALGGLEIAALSGFYLAAAAASVPVIVDGVIAAAAACVATQWNAAVRDVLIAGHRSSEPAASVALEWLGLEPLIELELRLGEGSGAALAVPLVQAAAAIMAEMATFDAAGVTNKSA